MIKIVFCHPAGFDGAHGALTSLLATYPRSGSAVADQPLGLHRLTLTLDDATALAASSEPGLSQRAARLAEKFGLAHAVLCGELATDGPGLLVCDVDSTLITAEVIDLIADEAGSREEVAAITDRAMGGELDFTTSLRARVATFEGLDVAALDRVRARVQLSPGAGELVESARRWGCQVALVSGGFAEIVEPLASGLGLTLVRANRLGVHAGRLTGACVGPIVDRGAKAEHLRQFAHSRGVALARTVAIGDGANDLDMLGAAGLGIAYCAKPIVREQTAAAIPFARLDAVAALTGLV